MKLMDREALEKPFGYRVVHCDRAFAPTGEGFTVLHAFKLGADEKEAEAAACIAFNEYAEGRAGTLYWRTPPEIRTGDGVGGFFMRLLISDKEHTR